MTTDSQPMRKVERPGFRPMPLALMDQMSVCERCWSVVCRFHQEPHDLWHASMSLHSHPAGAVAVHPNGCCCGGCP